MTQHLRFVRVVGVPACEVVPESFYCLVDDAALLFQPVNVGESGAGKLFKLGQQVAQPDESGDVIRF